MITQYEVPGLLREALPQIRNNSPIDLKTDVYRSVLSFTNYTGKVVLDHNFVVAKRCFRLAGWLYRNGDNIVKTAIENIFVYSFSSFMRGDKVEKLILRSMIPVPLYDAYIKQVNSCSC